MTPRNLRARAMLALPTTTAPLDALIELLQERAVSFGDERALHQAGARLGQMDSSLFGCVLSFHTPDCDGITTKPAALH
jgi:hypothetical protein